MDPETTVDVPITVSNSDYVGDIFIDLCLRGEENGKHCILLCMISTKSAVVPFVNLSDKCLIIKKGTVTARGEPATLGPSIRKDKKVYSVQKSKDESKIPIDRILLNDQLSNEVKDQ